MNWTLIILAGGLALLGFALVLLAAYLKRDATAAPPEGLPEETAAAEPSGAFIDLPLQTDMSSVLLGSAPLSATGPDLGALQEAKLAASLEEPSQHVPEEIVAPAAPLGETLEWEEALPAALFESDAAPSGAEPAPSPEEEGPDTIEVQLPDETEAAPVPQALVPRGDFDGHRYSWHIRHDVPVLGAAAGVAVAASLIGYAIGRRRKKG